MQVSVIIPTYNGAHKLRRVLTALSVQEPQPYEVIVVVDGSTDASLQVLQALRPLFKQFIVLSQANAGRAKVRNKGAEAASGNLLVFLDDDMEPAAGWLAAHVQHHQQVQNSIVGGAQVEPLYDEENDFVRYRAWKRRIWLQPLLEWGVKPQVKHILYLSGSNCSVARDLFFTLSGFDPRIRDGEDYDFALRAMHAGMPVYYLPNAFAWHHDPINLRQFIQRNRQYYAAGSTLMRLAPEYYKGHFSKRVRDIASGKKFFYRMFCFPATLMLIESRWFGTLPRRVRFKCYDWLVTANAAYFPHLLDL